MDFQRLVRVLIQNNFQNDFFDEILSTYFSQPEFHLENFKLLLKSKEPEILQNLIMIFKKEILYLDTPIEGHDSLVILNNDRIYELLFKQNIVEFFLRKMGDIEALICCYFIQNGSEINLNMVVQGVSSYIKTTNDQQIRNAVEKLVNEKFIVFDNVYKLNIQKIYSHLRSEQIGNFIREEFNDHVASIFEMALELSSLYSSSQFTKQTEGIKLEQIKFSLIEKNPNFFKNQNFNSIISQMKEDCKTYCYITEDSIKINLSSIILKMKLYIVENLLNKKGQYFLRVFKGISVGINELNEMSEKLLIPERKLKSIIFDLERMGLILRYEKTSNQISFYENLDEYLKILIHQLQKMALRILVRKQFQQEKQNDDVETFFLKQTKFSTALVEICTKLMILMKF